MTAQHVLDFWFADASQPFWFTKNDDFDEQIRQQFAPLWARAIAGELAEWRDTTRGRLAEIIVLDQFSRNLNRHSPLAFAYDSMALILAQEIVKQADFADLKPTERQFALLPFMHSESAVIHAQAVELFAKFTSENVQHFEHKHKVIIDRFGRYPHRNAVLGRASSDEEWAFLQEPDSAF